MPWSVERSAGCRSAKRCGTRQERRQERGANARDGSRIRLVPDPGTGPVIADDPSTVAIQVPIPVLICGRTVVSNSGQT
ncbi:hypothetical protein GCM10009853_011160 [Glycomyces scopariae]